MTKDWKCLEYSNFQHYFISITNQLVVMGGTVDKFYMTLSNGRLTIWLKWKKQVEQKKVRSICLKVVRANNKNVDKSKFTAPIQISPPIADSEAGLRLFFVAVSKQFKHKRSVG